MGLLCFNIDCGAHYRRGESRIFFVATNTPPNGQVMSTADIRYWFCHWLCPSCAKRMMIVTRSGDCVSAQHEQTPALSRFEAQPQSTAALLGEDAQGKR
jgi:hypothetical protein